MKTVMRAQLGQSVNLTPQLLQSIRLLQLTAPQLELEVRQALERNPMLEHDETDTIGETDDDAPVVAAADDAAAWDELPEAGFTSGGALGFGDDDACARIADGVSSDPRLRLLRELDLQWRADDLAIAGWWLDRCDDRGYLEAPLVELIAEGCAALRIDADALALVRVRLLHGPTPGVAAAGVEECLIAQLRALPACATRALAEKILCGHVDLLAAHDHAALALALGCDTCAVRRAESMILALRAAPFEADAEPSPHVVPDVVVWSAGGAWRVALNPHAGSRVRVAEHCERALAGGGGSDTLRGLLDEARWLVRGIAMRNDTLLRTTQVLVERQRAYLERGDEALAPLTLREVADAIGMHESTVSRITSGKYIQTPRGTLELKRFFAVQLDGATVAGAAVKAMVKRLIQAEPAHAPLADDTIAGLLARQGVRIARRTVAKYRDQLSIGAARARCRPLAYAVAS